MNELELSFLYALEPLRSSDFFDRVMIFLSALGDSGFVFILISVALLIFAKTRRAGLLCSTALLLDFISVNVILKPLIARARPFAVGGFDLITAAPHDYSFPSGHTAAAFAFAASLIPFGKKYYIPAFIFATSMGFSRLYLMMHYPTDVLFGAIIGGVCGASAYFLWKHSKKYDIL